MLSKGFKIISPKTFEVDVESIEYKSNEDIVKINYAAICKADLRYYLGNRDKRILGLKYPMKLIHEATGVVLKSNSGKFEVGDKVVLVPNLCECDTCDFPYVHEDGLGENYCPKAKFASSNYDGFSSEVISYPASNLVKYDEEFVSDNVAVFSELISVAVSSLRRVDSLDGKIVGIWGDGILGYILANVIKTSYSNVEIICVGKNEEKLLQFDVDRTYVIKDSNIKKLKLDVAFECVGGSGSESAINEILEAVRFGAEIVLTGVSENGSNINTRKILEKAVRITGSTRSTINDFKKSVDLLQDRNMHDNINKLILSEYIVENISDYYRVFEKESVNRGLGKHILNFNL